jgi:spore coat polysaccharide biosynthesis protein SpsF
MIEFGAIIEARMNSKRLPNKVMLKINKKPVIEHLVDRLRFVPSINEILVATTTNQKDDDLCNFLKKKKIKYYRGEEHNVLDRVTKAAEKYKIKNIVQITGDCPLIDPFIVSQVINIYNNNNFDFVSNGNIRTYPDGMDVSVFSKKKLIIANNLAKKKYYREHVTLFFRKKKNLFTQCNVMAPINLHYPKLGLTLDELNDFKLIDKIITNFSKSKKIFTCLDIINYLKKNPKILKINNKVKRKGVPIKLKN